MPNNSITQHGLRWKDDSSGELVPMWTTSPDISIVKSLAVQHLPQNITDVDINFFAEGAFNKLYDVSSQHSSQRYLMRVSLPVDPFFKTESEVATLAYISRHTSIPVPKVIAYDSSANNKLGFEWILLEKVEGVPLSSIWENLPFDSKVSLTVEISDLLARLDNLHFTQIGSLYFSTIRSQVNSRMEPFDGSPANDKKMNVDRDIGTDFVVGRMVSPWFFRDKRILLPSDRGPFCSSYDLMMAKTQIQIERIKNLSPSPTDEYYSETDEMLADDQEPVLETCYKLRELIPSIFPPLSMRDEIKTLYHDDLSASNIIVDPVSNHLTGIIDWESVAVCPAWESSEYPRFLRGIEVEEPAPFGTPGIDESGLVEIRKDWEKVLLRRVYFQSSQYARRDSSGISPANRAGSDGDVKRKRQFAKCLEHIETRWTASRYWLENVLSIDCGGSEPRWKA